jgi:hypothetical protein
MEDLHYKQKKIHSVGKTNLECGLINLSGEPQLPYPNKKINLKFKNPQAAVDHFQISLNNEQKSIFDILNDLSSNLEDKNKYYLEKYANLIEEVYECLRSKIFPKKRYRSLAEFLDSAATKPSSNNISIRAVLASPTALKELPYFINYANIYKKYGFNIDLKFFMVRWEYLNEAQSLDQPTLDSIYQEQSLDVKKALINKGWEDAELIPVNTEIDFPTGKVTSPSDFHDCNHEVMSAKSTLPPNTRLSSDINWVENFYNKQDSLQTLGKEQAFCDLVIRRAIGKRISEEYSAFAANKNHYYMMLTSELNGRFLRCYDTLATIHNLSMR